MNPTNYYSDAGSETTRVKQIHKFDTEKFSRLSTEETVDFLENYRRMILHRDETGSKLISIKMPHSLLNAFKLQAKAHGMPYQTLIKHLMKEWLSARTVGE
jgi:predicted DNA binding CopG/RHH family protein